MISKSQIQLVNALRINKFRSLHKKFVVEGPKIVGELLSSDLITDTIFATNDWILENSPDIPANSNIVKVKPRELERVSAMKTPNQVVAVVNLPESLSVSTDIFSDLVIMLDEIKDPGNLGTIIRTANWFGIQHLICSNDSVDAFNPKVVQASMGSVFRVKIYYEDLKSLLAKLDKNTNVYGALLNGKDIYEIEKKDSGILLIGNESRGISNDLMPFITHPVSIPSFSNSDSQPAESLNASIATAILCSEFKRPSE